MTASAATASRASTTKDHEPRAERQGPRPAAARGRPAGGGPRGRAGDLPREYRIAHVYRTLGGGLVAEYDPD